MEYIFCYCYDLKSIELSNFDTSRVTKMNRMFNACYDLISLDLGHFNTSLVNTMESMFYDCKSLIYLNITSFDTSSVTDMSFMFRYINKMNFINVSNFNTSKVTTMQAMFARCSSLTSIDLSKFDISKVIQYYYMFYECKSLNYLNIFNFKIPLNYTYYYLDYIFDNINKTFKYCLKEDDNYFFKGSYGLYQYDFALRDCSEKCYGYNKRYIYSSKLCVDDCKSYNYYEYNFECVIQCPKRTKSNINNTCELLNCQHYYNFEQTDCLDAIPEGFYENDTILKTINKCPIECKTCNNSSVQKNLCISCNNNYFPKINDSLNIYPYIKCYNYWEGYYLDNNDSYLKPCYNSCRSCFIKGDEEIHNCF